jgi:phospholipase/carboxylesterase
MSPSISHFVSKDLEHVEPGQAVIILLHGYGANERDLSSLMNFLPELPWAALRAPEAIGNEAFAWCGVANPLKPEQAEIESATSAIWSWVEQNIPEDSPLVVLGFSQGGLMATQLLRTHPSRLLATVILAGFLFEGEQPADSQLELDRPKVFYGRGVEDLRIPREAISALNSWLQKHTRAQTKTYEGLGHEIDARVMNDVAQYLAGQLEKI